jgi:hypothetical protein
MVRKIKSAGRQIAIILQQIAAIPISFLPEFPYRLFYSSTLLSILVMLLFAPAVVDKELNIPHPEWLDSIVAHLDPVYLHLLSAILICSLIMWIGRRANSERQQYLLTSILIPVVVLAVSYIIGSELFKPALSYYRPTDRLAEPSITTVLASLRSRLPFFRSYGEGVPTGYIVRQLALFYSLLWVQWQPNSPIQAPWKKGLMYSLNSLLLGVAIFSRVYRNPMTLFDIFLSIGAGALIFWVFLISLYALGSRSYQKPLAHLAAMYLVCAAALLYYSKEPAYWLQTSFLVLFGLALVRTLSNVKPQQEAWGPT